jgi:hypothetical protein
LIAVLSSADDAPAVEEFFQLFKTPWEYYQPDREYDIVLVTSERVPELAARLLLVYSSGTTTIDRPNGIRVTSRQCGATVHVGGTPVPIYGSLTTFDGDRANAIALTTTSGSIAGVRVDSARGCTIRLGYDLFTEVKLLLSVGQPTEHARVPTLDLHIQALRNWILEAGLPLLEIPPIPAGHTFSVCLTHDIDFVGIGRHKFDHTMWGFLYRSTFGAVRDLLRGRIPVGRLLRVWRAVGSLPFVYLGWAKDFWDPFEWYLRVEENLPATYFLIPFKRCAGDRVPGHHPSRRATAYDVRDLPEWTATLMKAGCELGVHGIDAWHSVEKGRDELARIAEVTGDSGVGVRMHWLLNDADTAAVVEKAGYAYDSTAGYNETIGYRNGTGQVFRPAGAQALLELPLHIQDGALFYSQRLDLSQPEAEARCAALIENAGESGGVLNVLWHDRSHAPERCWGDFYVRLLQRLKASRAWFGTGRQVVGWFQKRRDVRFETIESAAAVGTVPRYDGATITPPLIVRLYRRGAAQTHQTARAEATLHYVDVPWNGKPSELTHELLNRAAPRP